MTLYPGPILVTGSSSGIGRHLVESLSAAGHLVYACARSGDDLTSLGEIENVTPLELDVRKREAIRNAVEAVDGTGKGLYGLVNNAGIGGLGGFSTFTDEAMTEIFDVNVFGPHRMTNAFLPRLLESRGRIVNIGSMGGQITGKYFGPYTMTKHALEAYSASLREELNPHGIEVSIVQPGGIVTEIEKKSEPGTTARLRSAKPPFDVEATVLLKSMEEPFEFDPDQPESATNRNPSPPEAVTRAVTHALFSRRPRPSYLVGTRWEGDRIIHALIGRLLDANESPALGYSRDELTAVLDQHLRDRTPRKES